MTRAMKWLIIVAVCAGLMSQAAGCSGCDPNYWDCDWKPPTPGPTPAPTLPNPYGIADCGYGTMENFSGHQYWGRVLKTDGAGRLTVVNVRKADETRPNPDLDNLEQLELKAWGLEINESRGKDAARVQAKVTPPGSTVKFRIDDTWTDEEIWVTGEVIPASIANEHNWSLNLRLVEAGVAQATRESEGTCLAKISEKRDAIDHNEGEAQPITWERLSEQQARLTFGDLTEGVLYQVTIDEEVECMGPLAGRSFHIAATEQGESTLDIAVPPSCGMAVPTVKGWIYDAGGTRVALHPTDDQ